MEPIIAQINDASLLSRFNAGPHASAKYIIADA
jgi:hypothetical protein